MGLFMADLTSIFKNGFDGRELNNNKYLPESDLLQTLIDYGFNINSLESHNDIVRVNVADDKPSSKNGWYVIYDVSVDFKVCIYGNWKLGDKKKWTSININSMSSKERKELDGILERGRLKEAEARKKKQSLVAEKAFNIIKNSDPANKGHKYLSSKQVHPVGISQNVGGRSLIVPVKDVDDNIISLQFIDEEGKKIFLKGGRKKGGIFPITPIVDGEDIFLSEGLSTGLTIYQATSVCVVVSFDINNLVYVAGLLRSKYRKSKLIICADNDQWTDGNPGLTKSNRACKLISGCSMIYPQFKNVDRKPTDFNDLMLLEGIDEVRRQVLGIEEEVHVALNEEHIDSNDQLLTPPGILNDIVDYYNRSARHPQPMFAVQTALSIVSLFLGRKFRTNKNNFSSLFFLNVAKSSTGKEHSKTVIEDILELCGQEHLISGSGYTSSGAIFSELLKNPRHITIIDELGRVMSSIKKQQNSNREDSITALMEVFGRCHGIMRPPAYSSMTLTKKQRETMEEKQIKNPAITLLGMTTPDIFYDAMKLDSVGDGFLGRFIIVNSEQERVVPIEPDIIDVPKTIKTWYDELFKGQGNLESVEMFNERPTFKSMKFSDRSLKMIYDFASEIVEQQNELDKHRLAPLLGRTKEKAMRLAMIVSKSIDPKNMMINENSMRWAIDYIKHCDYSFIEVAKKKIVNSQYEKDKNEILEAIEGAGKSGVTRREMGRRRPFKSFKKAELEEILDDLATSELIDELNVRKGMPGRARISFVAIRG